MESKLKSEHPKPKILPNGRKLVYTIYREDLAEAIIFDVHTPTKSEPTASN